MGRAGRVAPRICSTLELRTHAPSSLMVSLSAPANAAAGASKLLVPASPPSPGTPVQVAPASVRPVLQAWPQDALQVVQRQMEALRSQSSEASSEPAPSSRKRELESEESNNVVTKISQHGDGGVQGFEVALQTQPALPNDWEQFLDLKTGQFYYFHWSSCKRAKQNPRELVRQADETVQAHLREAHIRGEAAVEHIELDTLPYDDDNDESGDDDESESGCCSSDDDIFERISGNLCESVAAPRERCNRELGNDGSSGSTITSEEQAKEGQSQPTSVMVVSGCHSCSMFVMLCLSSPACPSCGARSDDRNGIP